MILRSALIAFALLAIWGLERPATAQEDWVKPPGGTGAFSPKGIGPPEPPLPIQQPWPDQPRSAHEPRPAPSRDDDEPTSPFPPTTLQDLLDQGYELKAAVGFGHDLSPSGKTAVLLVLQRWNSLYGCFGAREVRPTRCDPLR